MDLTYLYKYQLEGIDFLKQNKKVLLSDDIGLGKSVQALYAIDKLEAYPCLIVCPASLKLNWARECNKWINIKLNFVINSKKESFPYQRPSDFYIINYDIIHRYTNSIEQNFKSLIIDESHYIKNFRSRRTKSILQIAKKIEFKFLLTGTPILNRPIELASQLQVLDILDKFGGYYTFARRYAGLRHNGYGWVADGATHLDELHQRLKELHCFLRRTKQEVLPELPERRVFRVDVAPQQTEKINRQETRIVNEFDTATNNERFKNVMELFHLIGQAKIPSACEWISNFLEADSGKLVVFARHRIVQLSLFEAFSEKAVRITSEESTEERIAAIDRFIKDPKISVIICSLNIAGVGLDGLQNASHTILFVELGWNPPTHDQAIGRVHRLGQKEQADAYFLVIPYTFDEDVWNLVQCKQTSINKITGDVILGMKSRQCEKKKED